MKKSMKFVPSGTLINNYIGDKNMNEIALTLIALLILGVITIETINLILDYIDRRIK